MAGRPPGEPVGTTPLPARKAGWQDIGAAAYATAVLVGLFVMLGVYFVATAISPLAEGGRVWLGSALMPAPERYFAWAAAIVVDVVTAVRTSRFVRDLPPNAHHLPERFGLFTLILLGESIIAIEKHGGSAVGEKMQVGDMGFAAYFNDSEGNLMGLWQNAG